MDNTKVLFNSGWLIDEMEASGEMAAGVGTTEVYTLPDSSHLPVFDIQFSPGSDQWYNVGPLDHTGSINSCHAWIDAGKIYFSTDIAGTIRYYIWSDKVNY
jgi:hypothetical protein